MRVDGSSSSSRYYDDSDPDAAGSRSVEKRPPPTPADATTKKDPSPPKAPEVDSRPASVLHGIGETIFGSLFGIVGGIAKTASDVAHGSLRALVRPFEAVASVAVFRLGLCGPC